VTVFASSIFCTDSVANSRRLLGRQNPLAIEDDADASMPTEAPGIPDRGRVVKVDAVGNAQWNGAANGQDWTLVFYYNTLTRKAWGCDDDGAKCLVDGSGTFADGKFQADVLRNTGMVNHIKADVAACSDGEELCPEQTRSFEGSIRCLIAGRDANGEVVGVIGTEGALSADVTADYA